MSFQGRWANFIYMEDLNFTFAYVPKVACTNWKAIFRKMNGAGDWLDPSIGHDNMRSGLHVFAPEQEAGLLESSDALYAMVRSPFSRSLSAYLSKIQGTLNESEKNPYFYKVVEDVEGFRSGSLDSVVFPQISFDVFLLWLRDSGSPLTSNEHWASQSDLLRIDQFNYNFIGRFENLQADSRRILEGIGFKEEFPTQAQVGHVPTGAEAEASKHMTPLSISIISELYYADFEAFRYQREVHF
jgi:hypothetical protein